MLGLSDERWLLLWVTLVFLVVIEACYRLGVRHRDADEDAARSHISGLQGALLGLLALLLGFTFAMAVSRFDARKSLVLEEANAIGKAYWRAQLLQRPERKDLGRLFDDYVASRIQFHRAQENSTEIESASAASVRIAQQIATLGNAIQTADPSLVTTLFMQAVNDMVDVNEKRRVALENHVPEPVMVLLFLVATASIAFIAYGTGLHGRRRVVSTGLFAAMIALVLTFIVDIDQPRSGLLTVGQESMLRLKATLEQRAP
jgi:hypothetical protein